MTTDIKNLFLYGCSHYKRNCEVYAKCCKKWYKCNICHNEKNKDHLLVIADIKRIKCLFCNKVQLPKEYCSNDNCNKKFGNYFCNKCIIYNNNSNLYHCDKCNRCIYNYEDNVIHCDICNFCDTNETHICIENKLNDNCGICMNNMINCQKKITILECGHPIHNTCLNDYIYNILYISKNKKLLCPICRHIVIDIDKYDNYKKYNEYEMNKYNNTIRNTNLIRPISYSYNTESDNTESDIEDNIEINYESLIEIILENNILHILDEFD